MKLRLLLILNLFLGITLQAQEYFPKNDGVSSKNTNYTVFKNAKIHTNPNEVIENGMFAVYDGKITAVGKKITVPKNSQIIDLKGKEVYASFIDLFSEFGIEQPEKADRNGSQPQYEANREGYYWNDHIRPETSAVANFKFNKEEANKLHKLGFGVVNTHVPDGILRGSGMLVALKPEGTNGERILKDRSAQYLSFSKSVKSQQSYPTSTMGAMALLRQMYIDAAWYEGGNSQTKDLALEALNNNKDLIQIFKTDNLLNEFRADKVGDEFGIQYVILGSGYEYERLKEIKNTKATFILPLDFPDAYDVSNPLLAKHINLEQMKRWYQAPANAKLLAETKVPFAFTTYKLDAEKDFKSNLLKAIQYGLSKEDALAALTTVPAKIIGMEASLGEIKEGAWANFIITSGDYFETETTLFENWIQGERTVLESMDITNINGDYTLKINGEKYALKISGKATEPKSEVKTAESTIGSKLVFKDNWFNLLLSSVDSSKTAFTRLTAKVPNPTNKFTGKAILANGNEVTFTATKKADTTNLKKINKKDTIKTLADVTYPNMAYGFKDLPKRESILFKNATVWTNEDQGILKNTDVLVKNGKIAKVGKDLDAGSFKVIDASGKHITAGIIDEHSHIAASSINEAGHNSTAEVRMEDVVDPTDINIYRNLAGGVTTVQLLHGSANPIGGQSAILKLKWGNTAEGMIYPNSPKYIKFALGENVKQSNWGSRSRFPQTRMGVEQLYHDYFNRALAYEKEKVAGKNFRKDLELETLLEIIKGDRFITSHSYIQSEINMLMKVAESFGFRINTFTHILEGYKIADKMKAHGVGASTFSDWWAYKYEVNDAIPYNAAIMHNMGITTAINSDDPEMSRRLNQEAAKSVKYGGVSEEEALKFVTLNPAKLLHIDHEVGSIKEGKQADLVLWNDHPLSIYAKAEKTLIDGIVYFDINRDQELREQIHSERNILITEMLAAKNSGVKTQPVTKKVESHIHCNLLEEVH